VTDAPQFADVLRATLGLTPRQLRDLVEEHDIPHARRHAGARHVMVRVDHVLTALGLGAPAKAVAPEREPRWDEDEAVQRAARGSVS
jgi:hypothetical protein